nr:hypothetical protein [Tanacetum cinerariifolium]
ISMVAAAGQKDVNSQLHAHSSNLSSLNSKKTYNTASATLMRVCQMWMVEEALVIIQAVMKG